MVHRTMQGREIDMDKLMRQNELMPAIGNMNVNARGDELGAGGKIVRRREEIVAEYYEEEPKPRAKKVEAVKEAPAEKKIEEAPVVAKQKKSQSEE